MDYYGSNATPMGGSIGRCDASIAAVEPQKAEGVSHTHGFYYFQNAGQFCTLLELGQMLQRGMLSSKAMKEYISYSICAEYPDVEKFEEEQSNIEKDWPAYESGVTLSRLPHLLETAKMLMLMIGRLRIMTACNIVCLG